MRYCICALVGVCLTCAAVGQSAPADPYAGYHPYARMMAELRELVSNSGGAARLANLATSIAGRETPVLILAKDGERAMEGRQAVLIVGGVDADFPGSSETALRVATNLLRDANADASGPSASLLKQRIVYIVPRLNVDGVERFFEAPKHEAHTNTRAWDDDRDGVIDEDDRNDLDGDGVISIMRWKKPGGAWIVDPDEPRLMKKADAAKGEIGEYELGFEGVDNDADGEINDDPLGGVDDDRNWPHFYESGARQTGPHQLSEPETRGLAQFVVDHPEIGLAIVYGRHDNLVITPKGKQRGPEGVSYRDLHEDDIAVYESIGEKYRELSGLSASAECAAEGALYAWLYSQRGIPTFATRLWWPLDRAAPASQPAESQATSASAPAPKADKAKAPAGKPVAATPEDRAAARVESNDVTKAWLKYSDALRGGAGHKPWTPFEHPTLGKVEIGGMAPYFMTTPPSDELDPIAERETKFLVELAGMTPALLFEPPKVSEQGAGVWRVELTLVNEGRLPTHLAISRLVENPPIAVRYKGPPERLLGGKSLERVAWLAPGGAARLDWLVAGVEGDSLLFTASNRMLGRAEINVRLQDGDAAGGDK